MTVEQQAPWLVWVYFAGLILFVRDPYTDRMTHALLFDGRPHHDDSELPYHRPNDDHSQGYLPKDDPACLRLTEGDFEHHPLVWWSTGKEGGPVIGQQGQLLRRVGGSELANRGELYLEWQCPRSDWELCEDEKPPVEPCGYETAIFRPADGARESPGCATGIGEARKPGACPMGPRASGLAGLPGADQTAPTPGYRRSFFWVPHLQDLGAVRRVARSALEGRGKVVHEHLFARMPLAHGRISSGDFTWVLDEDGPWIPRLRFESGDDLMMQRAGAEVVVWELEAPEGAVELDLVFRPFDRSQPELRTTFVRGESPIRITVSNSPKRRCLGRPHPGRSGAATAEHFRMLFRLLEQPPNQPADESVACTPKVPGSLRPTGFGFMAPKNVMRYDAWVPEEAGETGASAGGTSASSAYAGSLSFPYGDVADAVGTKDRPICVPASSDG
jgi:hypothetical protein